MAWIWARTVPCPNPACGATMALLNSFVLSRRKNREAWLEPIPDRSSSAVRFSVRHGSGAPKGGTVTRTGATCLTCGSTTPLEQVRAAARAGQLGAQLVCTVGEGHRQRVYVEADEEQIQAASQVAVSRPVLGTSLPEAAMGFRVQGYGLTTHEQLFTARQLQTLVTFTDLVGEARRQVLADSGDREYADAVATYLGLAIGRLANRGSSQCFWNPGRDTIEQVFARPALPMIWAYTEANPFSNSSGNFLGQVGYLVEALARVPARGAAQVRQLDARTPRRLDGPVLVCTDPPYYDNIPFADLSDFFYVWLRRCLRDIHPELFGTILVPKSLELIAEPARHPNKEEAASFFETGLGQSFANIGAIQDDGYPFTVFYAFKQTEDKADGAGPVSTGWEKMLQGLVDAEVQVTGTWPIRTEQPGGLREVGRAALASSVVLVCRRRPAQATRTTRREFLTALRVELPDALRQLQHGNIAPVDLAQACIGPAMAVFSRYSTVMEADGTKMAVRAALSIVNGVLDEVLASQEADFDANTRWAVAWFEEYGFDKGSAGVAETLSKAKNTSIGGLVTAGILQQSGNRCWLLGRCESHLRSYAEPARELAYRLFGICEKKGWTQEALAYNSVVTAWPELSKLARQQRTTGIQTTLEE